MVSVDVKHHVYLLQTTAIKLDLERHRLLIKLDPASK